MIQLIQFSPAIHGTWRGVVPDARTDCAGASRSIVAVFHGPATRVGVRLICGLDQWFASIVEQLVQEVQWFVSGSNCFNQVLICLNPDVPGAFDVQLGCCSLVFCVFQLLLRHQSPGYGAGTFCGLPLQKDCRDDPRCSQKPSKLAKIDKGNGLFLMPGLLMLDLFMIQPQKHNMDNMVHHAPFRPLQHTWAGCQETGRNCAHQNVSHEGRRTHCVTLRYSLFWKGVVKLRFTTPRQRFRWFWFHFSNECVAHT